MSVISRHIHDIGTKLNAVLATTKTISEPLGHCPKGTPHEIVFSFTRGGTDGFHAHLTYEVYRPKNGCPRVVVGTGHIDAFPDQRHIAHIHGYAGYLEPLYIDIALIEGEPLTLGDAIVTLTFDDYPEAYVP